FAAVRLRPGSRIEALRRSPVRGARRRSGEPSDRSAESVMASSLSPCDAPLRVNKWLPADRFRALWRLLAAVGDDHCSARDAELARRHREAAAARPGDADLADAALP